MAQGLLIGSLNSGELSPLLDGRVDKDFYAAGAKRLENFIPQVQGPVIQRSGTGYVKEVKDSSKRVVLIPWEFSTDDAYILEFGDQYMRVYRDRALVTQTAQNITGITKANPAVVTYSGSDTYANGDRVFISGVVGMVEVNNREFTVANVNTGANTFELSGIDSSSYGSYTSGGTTAEIYEISTPYAVADLVDSEGKSNLTFAQQGDVMYIAHRLNTYALRKLSRTGHTAWTLATADLSKGPFTAINGDDSVRIRIRQASSTYTPGNSVRIYANSSIFESGHVGSFFYVEEILLDQLSVQPWAATVSIAGGGINSRQVSNDGNVYLLVASGSGSKTGTVAPVHTDGDAYDALDDASNHDTKKWRYLHSRWCVFKITAYTSAKQVTADIITYAPNGLDQPDFTISGAADNGSGLIRITTNSAHGYANGDYVNIRGVAGTTEANGDWQITYVDSTHFDLNGSAFVNAYSSGTDFVVRYASWIWAHGAFSTARGFPGVVAFHEGRLVLAQTTQEPDGWWLSESDSYESFKPKSANQILATNAFRGNLADGRLNKIEWALSMDDGLVFGTSAAEHRLEPATSTNALGPGNFRTLAISGYGSRPVQPVRVGADAFFAQRAGKKLRSLGYTPDASQRVGTELSVRAEHFFKSSPLVGMAWVQEPDALLWCIRADGALIAFTFQHEQAVYAWHYHILGGYSDSGDTAEPVVESVAAIPAPDGTLSELWLVVKRYIDGGTKRYIEYMRPRWLPSDERYTPSLEDAVMSDSGLTYDSTATTTVSGLWHLKGETVSVLADGKIHPDCTVDSSGKITLDYSASVIQIGLAMRARYKSMRLEAPTQTGTGQGRKKVVNEIAVRCIDATHLRYGRNFDTMRNLEFTKQSQPYEQPVPLFSGDKKVTWPGTWDLEAYLCLENNKPVPFGIAGVFPQIEVANA